MAEAVKQKRTRSSKADADSSTKAGPPRRRAEDRQAEALRNEVFGIAILAVAAGLLLAIASFDPDDVSATGQAALTGQAHNLIGPVGAFVADILLYIFGLAAFLLPITLATPGFAFLTGRRIRVKLGDAIGYPLLVLFCAMAAHLWMEGRLVYGHDAGGLIGTTGGEILRALFGLTGAYLIVYSVITLTFIITTRISVVRFAGETARPLAGRTAHGVVEARQRARGLFSGGLDRLVAWRDERADARDVARAQREVARAERKAARAEALQAARAAQAANDAPEGETIAAPQINIETDQLEAVEAEAPAVERAPKARVGGLLNRLKKAPKAPKSTKKAPARVEATPGDSGGFELGALPGAKASGPYAIQDQAAPAEHTAALPVLEADDAGVGFDDPLDAQAIEGADGDTILAPAIEVPEPVPASRPKATKSPKAARPKAQPEPAAPEGEGPVVKNRRKDESIEQLSMPLPGSEEIGPKEYVKPPLHFLDYTDNRTEVDPIHLRAQADRLVEALDTFRIQGRVTEIHPGPVVTMFEFEPAPGVRISRIAGLADDLAMALKAVKVRIVAPIPGKGVVGFEVPNAERETVFLKEIIGSKAFRKKSYNLPLALGKDIHGAPAITDLSKMPHLLVAGTTGSGKSVGVNGMITSLLYNNTPEEVRFIMVDPKMLELSIYEGIPHLLLPVVTDPKKAAMALKWGVDEMERRYELMKNAGVRDLRGFNRKVDKYLVEHEVAVRTGVPMETVPNLGAEEGQMPTKLPYIVVVIDEFADLMMVAGKDVEYAVARIAQKARAAGIHLILATQRPSTDVITGVIKANFPTRMAFRVSSSIDSRTILSTNGAENLLGKGDMLFMPPGTSRLTRVHGAFVSEEEIHQIVEFISAQQEPNYLDESVLEEGGGDEGGSGGDADMDPMYEEAVRCVARDGRASTSHLQRRLSLGYNRAARIVDQMERDGLVGPSNGAKPRKVNKNILQELVARWDDT